MSTSTNTSYIQKYVPHLFQIQVGSGEKIQLFSNPWVRQISDCLHLDFSSMKDVMNKFNFRKEKNLCLLSFALARNVFEHLGYLSFAQLK